MKNKFVAGIDVGGSHITSAIINISSGELLQKTIRRKAIDSKGEYQDIIKNWSSVISESFDAVAMVPKQIGIAMPGPFDYDEGICLIHNQDKYDALYGLNIKHLLAESLNIEAADIVLTNDAACFLYGELFSGAAKDCRDAVGLTLGTGLGSAYVKRNQVVDAEWWCAPFKNGIAEDYLSTRWFTHRYEELTGKAIGNVKAILTDSLVPKTIITQLFTEFAHNLGEFLGGRKLNSTVDMLVLGGNIAQSFDLFEEELLKTLASYGIYLSVKPAVLGENAALIGAASNCHRKSCELMSN